MRFYQVVFHHLNHKLNGRQKTKGQSLIELALVFPVLIFMLLGIAEGGLFLGRYLDLLDLTREAAREASRDDPFGIENSVVDKNTITSLQGDFVCPALGSDSSNVNFYYKAACFFSPPPPTGSSPAGYCTGPGKDLNFCSGYNRYVDMDLRTDDIVITAFTINGQTVSDVWPQPDKSVQHGNYWALSNKTGDTNPIKKEAEVWKKDCDLKPTGATKPDISETYVNNMIATDYGPPPYRGYVAVEIYYCYHSPLAILLFKPLRIHAYTIMPLANVQPTAEPSTPTPAP